MGDDGVGLAFIHELPVESEVIAVYVACHIFEVVLKNYTQH